MSGLEQVAATGGPWALVAFLIVLVVGAIVRGDLVPRRAYSDLKTELDYERSRSREMEGTIRDLVTEASRLAVALTAAAVPHPPQGLSTASAGSEPVE